MFLDTIGITQISFSELFNWVNSCSSTSQNNSFHISSFGTSEGNDSCLSKHLKTYRVNSLLVDNNKRFIVSFSNFVFELDNFSATLVSKPSFRFCHFISVSGIREEELRIDFSFFVLEWDIASQNIAVFKSLRHIWVSCTMIKNKTFNQLSITRKFVNHMHYFYHMQVNGLICNFDDVDWVYNNINKLVGKLGM